MISFPAVQGPGVAESLSSTSAPATRQVTFLPDVPWGQIGCQQSVLRETLRKPALPG